MIRECEQQLEGIWRTGGGHLLSRLWTSDVDNYRNQILQAFQRLLETDLYYCVTNDMEFVIWKTCYYNLVEALKKGEQRNRRLFRTDLGL